MTINWLITVLAALVPVVFGAIWYHPKVMGTMWMESSGMTEEKMKGSNMTLNMIFMFVFSFIIAVLLHPIVIHQYGLFSLLVNQPGMQDNPISNPDFNSMMDKYKDNFRTFGHGAFHGVVISLFFLMPIIWIGCMFEKRSWKYVLVTIGFWAISLAIMGGMISYFQ